MDGGFPQVEDGLQTSLVEGKPSFHHPLLAGKPERSRARRGVAIGPKWGGVSRRRDPSRREEHEPGEGQQAARRQKPPNQPVRPSAACMDGSSRPERMRRSAELGAHGVVIGNGVPIPYPRPRILTARTGDTSKRRSASETPPTATPGGTTPSSAAGRHRPAVHLLQPRGYDGPVVPCGEGSPALRQPCPPSFVAK